MDERSKKGENMKKLESKTHKPGDSVTVKPEGHCRLTKLWLIEDGHAGWELWTIQLENGKFTNKWIENNKGGK